jgi:DNA-binding response OmpR family regulator
MSTAFTASVVGVGPDILFVDSEGATARYTALLDEQLRVNVTPRAAVAAELIRRTATALVVTDLELEDGSGVDVCRTAKALPLPSTVLVTAGRVDAVPSALAAGCDGVLVKPFPPNLLVARVGRLLRERTTQLQLWAARSRAKRAHITDRLQLARAGTNRVWPNTHCPYCDHQGVTSFDYASMRRAWYACLHCQKVWMAKRQD